MESIYQINDVISRSTAGANDYTMEKLFLWNLLRLRKQQNSQLSIKY